MVLLFVCVSLLLLCIDGSTLRPDNGRYVSCGPLKCDVTYQYCDNGRFVTRPVCSLCADICSINRVGSIQLYIDHCLDVCPVFWRRQEEKLKTTTAVPATADTPAIAAATQDGKDSHLTLVVAIVIVIAVCVLLSGVVGYCVIANKGDRRRHMPEGRQPATQHIQLDHIPHRQSQEEYGQDQGLITPNDLDQSSDSGCSGLRTLDEDILQKCTQTFTSDLIVRDSTGTQTGQGPNSLTSDCRDVDQGSDMAERRSIGTSIRAQAPSERDVTRAKVRCGAQQRIQYTSSLDQPDISTTLLKRPESTVAHTTSVDTNTTTMPSAVDYTVTRPKVRHEGHPWPLGHHQLRQGQGHNTVQNQHHRMSLPQQHHRSQSYILQQQHLQRLQDEQQNHHRLVTNNGSGQFFNRQFDHVFPVTWPNPDQPSQRPTPAQDDPDGVNSDCGLALAGVKQTTCHETPANLPAHHEHPQQSEDYWSDVSDHYTTIGTEYSPNSDYENEHINGSYDFQPD